MSQQIQIQKQKNELAELIRSFKGKYEQITGKFAIGGTNKRCVWGALSSEVGWDGSGLFGPDTYIDRKLGERFPELIGFNGMYTKCLSKLVQKNNSGVDWEGLAQFVERGFKD